MSTVEQVLHFGVGQAGQVDSLEVFWPDGRYQLVTNFPSNQKITLPYEKASEKPAQSQEEYRTTLVSTHLVASGYPDR